MKIFSADPAVSFLAHARRFSEAAARGEVLAPAKSMTQMEQIIFNDRIDLALCGLFLLVVLSLLGFAVSSCIAARRSDRVLAREAVPGEMLPA
jgi:carbon starvation protein